METGKDIVKRVLVEDNSGKACRAELRGAVIAVTGEFATLLTVIPVYKSDFVSFNFQGCDTAFPYSTAGVENTGDGKVVIEAATQTDFFAPLVTGGKLNLKCCNFLLYCCALFAVRRRVSPAEFFDPEVQKINFGEGFKQRAMGMTNVGNNFELV